jgi:hypothetical protein
MLTKMNVEMPIKIGLGYLLDKHGELIIRNRYGVEKLATRIARRKTTEDRFLWSYSIWQGITYFRINFCSMVEYYYRR